MSTFFDFMTVKGCIQLKKDKIFRKLEALSSLENQVKALGSQDKLWKQNFLEYMKKVFEPITDTVKQTAQETIGVVEDPTRSDYKKRKGIK